MPGDGIAILPPLWQTRRRHGIVPPSYRNYVQWGLHPTVGYATGCRAKR